MTLRAVEKAQNDPRVIGHQVLRISKLEAQPVARLTRIRLEKL